MTIPSSPRLVAALRFLSGAAGGIAVAVGCLILIGWLLDIETLKRILPGLVAMNPATAVAFILAGASLRLLDRAGPLARALAVLVALIGLSKLVGILFGWDLGIDQLLFRDKLGAVGDVVRPNRMAPTTATNFLLLGLALLLADARTRSAQLLALLIASVAALAFIGYLYGVQSLTGVAAYIPMALHTALTFLALSTGLLCARPERGLMARVTSEGPGGAMLRRLLLAVVLLPLGIGGLILAGQRTGAYPETFGFALFVVLQILVFSVMAWANAVSLDRNEGARRAADAALRGAHDALEQRVAERTGDLTRVLGEIREGIAVLGVSAGDISASTTRLSAGATDTAAAVSETTTTLEEIRQTAHAASETAGQVAESAQNAARIAQDGRRAAEGTVEDVQGIRAQMEEIAECMTRLSEQTQAIGEIIATVNDLAEQSNLLAVNAAIEAAKAGEQGKGFAVVAQEVKNLADQSRQATRQVRTLLGDIQKATGAAATATERGSSAVEAGVAQSARAGESIQSLADRVTEAAEAASQIAASSQQQLVGMDQVALAMRHVHGASTQNVDSARQLETSARSLSDLGRRLRDLVERYDAS